MLKYLIAAGFAALLVSTGAQAAPAAASLAVTPAVQYGTDNSDLLVEVGNKKKWKKRYRHKYHNRHNYHRHHYHHHRYYRRPPPGWYRYSYRPYGWSRRGCIAIGPVWYCP
ncbi:hypothetical protein V6C03_00415 [Methyloligella sp. 2.7D]|uniref:hypothetical protein n=1 Tax=unclassified Methyloligella TaxID=2625955 RepID=UPI00157C6726|nr:hypothetical protein [Methyloligella sp. GL2]QKP76865.1 hypothetical protein HT051_05000 [Methyloligella sp. GL2]